MNDDTSRGAAPVAEWCGRELGFQALVPLDQIPPGAQLYAGPVIEDTAKRMGLAITKWLEPLPDDERYRLFYAMHKLFFPPGDKP